MSYGIPNFCPFCGNNNVVMDMIQCNFKLIRCPECDASMPGIEWKPLIDKWNTRAFAVATDTKPDLKNKEN